MPIKIFFCYAHEDEALLSQLKRHLKPLQRQGLIEVWHDGDISAGTEWEPEVEKHLNMAQIILLLVSPDFISSDYCYSIQMKRAVERHERGEARVIPIILRSVYWQGVLGNLRALPVEAKPVKSWHDPDEAFFNVEEGVREVVKTLLTQKLRNEGANHLTAKRYEEALEAFKQVLRFDPNDVVAHRDNGYTLLKLKRYDEGLEALEQALRLDPDATIAYNRKGIVRLLLESLQEAAHEERCLNEISNYYRRVADDKQYYLMILHRALSQRDQRAWELLEHYFHDIVLEWMRRHPNKTVALQYNTEENYIALTFERFWLATTDKQRQWLEFSTLTSVYAYLRACLNAAITDTLRDYARSKEESLSELADLDSLSLEEPAVEGYHEVWEIINGTLPNQREKRLAYLLFYCGLKPRDIVRYLPQEFSDAQEIYRLKRNMMNRLSRNIDKIRKQLSDEGT